MSFSKDLWDKAELVIKHSHDRRKEIEEYITALMKRIEAEETYARNVEEAIKITDRVLQGEESISTLAFSCFKFDCMNRSSQSRTFARSIKDQILSPMRDMLNLQTQECRQMEKDHKRVETQRSDLQYNKVRTKSKYDEEYKDKEESLINNEILFLTSSASKEKKSKASLKTNEIEKQLSQLWKNHERACIQHTTFLLQYYTENQRILDSFQSHEKQRLAKQEDNIIKMLIFETAMMKNLEYDIATITSQVDRAKHIDDIKAFVERYKSGKAREPEEEKSVGKSMTKESLLGMIGGEFRKRLEVEGNKEFRGWVERRFKGQMGNESCIFMSSQLEEFDQLFSVIKEAWKGKALKLMQIESTKSLLKNQANRLAVLLYFRMYQLTSNIAMSFEAYGSILTIVKALLDACYQSKDVFVARKVTNLAFVLYCVRESGDRLYLHNSLNEIKLFSSVDYWQASIFESVQEELYLRLGEDFGEHQQMREMSLVMGQLAMYCHQMVLLGYPNKQVRNVIGKFCRLYSIPQVENRDLAKTISASAKKYKELFSFGSESSISAQSDDKDRKESMQQIEEKPEGQILDFGNIKVQGLERRDSK